MSLSCFRDIINVGRVIVDWIIFKVSLKQF